MSMSQELYMQKRQWWGERAAVARAADCPGSPTSRAEGKTEQSNSTEVQQKPKQALCWPLWLASLFRRLMQDLGGGTAHLGYAYVVRPCLKKPTKNKINSSQLGYLTYSMHSKRSHRELEVTRHRITPCTY